MKENYDFKTEAEEIMRRGLNFGAEIRRRVPASFVRDVERKFNIDDLIEKVPDMLVEVYGEEKAKKEWRRFAKLFYSVASSGLEPDILATLRDIMAMYEKQLRTMYKGNDVKDYTSFEEVISLNEFYDQQENPTIEQGRHR